MQVFHGSYTVINVVNLSKCQSKLNILQNLL
ncbi:MAG: hypothetical protein EZS26_004100 [Candidatus Ordinivivax streblomastigis]|uniref:Uncharacterized protein n=1 Tax=Candidatus Ordinivivax streblomastigis TaxID=2540710 RepID=A0A5M8NT30_9BACT|nr:MAG: hypothetical protein EZS26_004100 [Candidatus Ordinivivax streblomastigis]